MARLFNETSFVVSFATGSRGDSIQVANTVKGMGDLMNSFFLPYIHGREAVSKVRRLLFMLRWSFDELPV